MQNVSFRNIDEFLEFLPQDQLDIVELLRKTIFECLPQVTEKLSYNVPFYRLNKGLCFIWPSAILWGKKRTNEGVRFGFNNGNLMQNEGGWLDKGTRKQIYWKDFSTRKEIDIEIVKSYIFEAALIDEQLKNDKNGIQRKTGRPHTRNNRSNP